MNILFRVDSATHIGIGHVMRCLTLANALSKQGAKCQFVCRAFNGHLAQSIQEAGHIVHLLPCNQDATFSSPNPKYQPPHCNWLDTSWENDFEQTQKQLENQVFDWLVIDHYALDERWQTQARAFAKKIMVIDDLADRPHDCEVLLDQNLGRQADDYAPYIPEHTQLMIGPKYALLRPEFAELRAYSLQRRQVNPQLKKLLISLGGVDKDNVTGQVLTALKDTEMPQGIEITVIMGATAPHLADVQAKAKQLPWQTEVVVNVNNMAQRMADADLAIGAAGSTSWERCCLGLPTLMLVLAQNQEKSAIHLDRLKICKRTSLLDFKKAIRYFKKINSLEYFSNNSSKLSDGMGTKYILNFLEK